MNIEIPDPPEGHEYIGITDVGIGYYYFKGDKWILASLETPFHNYPCAKKKQECDHDFVGGTETSASGSRYYRICQKCGLEQDIDFSEQLPELPETRHLPSDQGIRIMANRADINRIIRFLRYYFDEK